MSVERRVTQVLGAWAAGSVLAGGALMASGHRSLGRQTLLWGAVDGVIAGVGARKQRRGERTDPARLRRILLVNAGLDVGYLAAGGYLLRTRWRQDGAAVLVQGGFLLGLDTLAARALRA